MRVSAASVCSMRSTVSRCSREFRRMAGGDRRDGADGEGGEKELGSDGERHALRSASL